MEYFQSSQHLKQLGLYLLSFSEKQQKVQRRATLIMSQLANLEEFAEVFKHRIVVLEENISPLEEFFSELKITTQEDDKLMNNLIGQLRLISEEVKQIKAELGSVRQLYLQIPQYAEEVMNKVVKIQEFISQEVRKCTFDEQFVHKVIDHFVHELFIKMGLFHHISDERHAEIVY